MVRSNDSELSDLVDSMIEWLPDIDGNPSNQQQSLEDVNKDIAINAITKSLMDIESATASYNSPPAYPMHNVANVNTQSGQQVSSFFFKTNLVVLKYNF